MLIFVKTAYTDITLRAPDEPGKGSLKSTTNSVTLNVEPTHTIGTVKSMLRPEACVPEEGQYLLVYGEKELEDGSTLDECGIRDQDTILFCRRGRFPISVYTPSSKHVTMHADCLDTVRHVKEKLWEMTGHPVERQCLGFRRVYLDDNEKRLVSYGIARPPREGPDNMALDMIRLGTIDDPAPTEVIQDIPDKPKVGPTPSLLSAVESASHAHVREGTFRDFSSAFDQGYDSVVCDRNFSFLRILDTVSRPGNMPIFVEIAGTTSCVCFAVNPTDTIDTLKALISQFLTTVDLRHVLVLGKDLLVDGSSTLLDCGIKNRDVIQICDRRSFPVFICLPCPEESPGFNIKVTCFDTVGKVKEKIQDKTGIPLEKQRLKYCLVWLDDDERRLMDYGIVNPNVAFFDDPIIYLFLSGYEAQGFHWNPKFLFPSGNEAEESD